MSSHKSTKDQSSAPEKATPPVSQGTGSDGRVPPTALDSASVRRPSGPAQPLPGSSSSSGSGSGTVPMKSILRVNQPLSNSDSSSAKGKKSKAPLCASPQCKTYLNIHDTHSLCLHCLGVDHWIQEKEECPACDVMSVTSYNKCVQACQHFVDTGSWPAALYPRPRTQDGSVRKYGSKSGSGSSVQSFTSKRLAKIGVDPFPVNPLAQKLTNCQYKHWAATPPDVAKVNPLVYYPAEYTAFKIHYKDYVEPGDNESLSLAFKFLIRCFRTMLNKKEFDVLGDALPTLFKRFEANPVFEHYFPDASVPKSPPLEPMTDSDEESKVQEKDHGLSSPSEASIELHPDDPDFFVEEEELMQPVRPRASKRKFIPPRPPDEESPKRPREDPISTIALSARMDAFESTVQSNFETLLKAIQEPKTPSSTPVHSTPFKVPTPLKRPRDISAIPVSPSSLLGCSPVEEELFELAHLSDEEGDLEDEMNEAESIASTPAPDSDTKKAREQKIQWLSIAFKILGLPPVPPESSGRDLYGVKQEKVRRDTVPFLPEVMSILQGFVNQHFEALSKGRQNKSVKNIMKFCEAPKDQNTCFRNPGAVPSVLLDYIEDEARDKLGNSSASHAAPLTPGTPLAAKEKEALVLEDRAKLDIQLNNSLSIDLLAAQKLAQEQVSLLSSFCSDPPPDPTSIEDFSNWRQTVTNVTAKLNSNAEAVKMGIDDALYVTRDHLKLHAQNLIKGHVDRRAAWLSATQSSTSVVKEISDFSFQVLLPKNAPEENEAPSLLGRKGHARMKEMVDAKAKTKGSRPVKVVLSDYKPKKTKQQQRSARSVSQVSPLLSSSPNPDTTFKVQLPAPKQPFRGKNKPKGNNKGKQVFKKPFNKNKKAQ